MIDQNEIISKKNNLQLKTTFHHLKKKRTMINERAKTYFG